MKRVLHVSLALALSFGAAISAIAADPYTDIQVTDAFTPVSSDYTVEDKSKTIIVRNMPRIRSQGPFDTCAGCVAATIAQKYICDKHPDYVGLDCAKLPSKMEVSQLYMLAMANTNKKGQNPSDPLNHTSITISHLDKEAGSENKSPTNSLLNSKYIFELKSESCFEFDRLVEQYGSYSAEDINRVTKDLHELYKVNRNNATVNCDKCVAKINSALSTSIDHATFEVAARQETFSQFLYSLVFSKKCETVEMDKGPNIGLFPKVNESVRDRAKLEGEIVKALGTSKASNPVALSDICAYTYAGPSGRVCIGHAVVISGYKVVCIGSTPVCKSSLRVHNCWGQDWQKASTMDGWVDSEKLLANVSRGNSKISDGALSWYY